MNVPSSIHKQFLSRLKGLEQDHRPAAVKRAQAMADDLSDRIFELERRAGEFRNYRTQLLKAIQARKRKIPKAS